MSGGTVEGVGEHYDRLDEFYRAVWGEQMHHGYWRTGRESLEMAKQQLLEQVSAEMGLQAGMTACDIGCGYGVTTRWLAQTTGARVLGITNSPAQARYAAGKQGGEHAEVLAGDWLAWAGEDESFDAAMALESAEHFADKAAFINQARRCLCPGGRLVIAGWMAGQEAEGGRLLEEICAPARMPRLAALERWRALLEDRGFVVTKSQDWTKSVARTWPRMGLVALRQIVRRPGLMRHFLSRGSFALAALRITAAFQRGQLRYGVVTARRG